MKTTKDFWEDRYLKYQNKIEGVLFKSLPISLNLYIHNWMLAQIEQQLPKKDKIQILDIGCGYGRLAIPLSKKFPKAFFAGVDISRVSIDLYNKNLKKKGKGYVSSIEKMPFKNSEFDLVYVVTTLMYLSKKEEQKNAFKEVVRVLKPGGKVLFIERSPVGYMFITLGGLVEKIRGKVNMEIPAVSFSVLEMSRLFKDAGILDLQKTGITFFTILFYFIYGLIVLNEKLGESVIFVVFKLDKLFSNLLTPSLYISYIGEKKR